MVTLDVQRTPTAEDHITLATASRAREAYHCRGSPSSSADQRVRVPLPLPFDLSTHSVCVAQWPGW